MYGVDAFRRDTGVSRETCERLEAYASLLVRWQRRINLVSESSLGALWRRHFLDSAQLGQLLPPPPARLADVGSGAGFPGLVLAIMGAGPMTLIEANARRCAFLREAARITETAVTVHVGRVDPDGAPGSFAPADPLDAVLARGCAPLPRLLHLVFGILSPHTYCIFPKGRGYRTELEEARRSWSFDAECHPSLSDDSGTILRLRHVSPS